MDSLKIFLGKLQSAPVSEKPQIFLKYCEILIQQKEQGKFREEYVADRIVQILLEDDTDFTPEIEAIFDHTSEMEMPREMSTGAGINIGDKWTQELADAYKAQQYIELLRLIAVAKEKFK